MRREAEDVLLFHVDVTLSKVSGDFKSIFIDYSKQELRRDPGGRLATKFHAFLVASIEVALWLLAIFFVHAYRAGERLAK